MKKIDRMISKYRSSHAKNNIECIIIMCALEVSYADEVVPQQYIDEGWYQINASGSSMKQISEWCSSLEEAKQRANDLIEEMNEYNSNTVPVFVMDIEG